MLMEYDRDMGKSLTNLVEGLVEVPDGDTERPSLWAYYYTLPVWCRDNHIIRNMLIAFEYNQPRMSFR